MVTPQRFHDDMLRKQRTEGECGWCELLIGRCAGGALDPAPRAHRTSDVTSAVVAAITEALVQPRALCQL